MIPYGRQSLGQAEIDAVVEVLRSEKLTQGPKIPEFEQALGKAVGAPLVAAVSNGTAALHLACLALDLRPGDWLWTTPISFVASANCGLYCGARIDFVDIDPQTRNISVAALRDKLHWARRQQRLPKILVVVHFAGSSCDMAAIHELATEFQIKVIEDAAHALGSFYRGAPVGSCHFSDLTTFSFHPVKTIATGEGGAISCRSEALRKKLKMLSSHGLEREPAHFSHWQGESWYYEQQLLGFNYRLTDIQAALGIVQLQRLELFVDRRRYLVERYNRMFADLPVRLPRQLDGASSAWHIYVIEVDEKRRATLIEALKSSDIASNIHYWPIHLQPFYRHLGFAPGDFPVAENYAKRALTLPLFPDLTDVEQDKVVAVVRAALCEG